MLDCDQERDTGTNAAAARKPANRQSDLVDAERSLVCVQCKHRITANGERIEIDGSHAHTCLNPHGYSFRVGCFAHAPGATPIGEQTAQHSWFSGYRWQVDYCAACGAHLGWFYTTNSDRFHGLIFDRLTDCGES